MGSKKPILVLTYTFLAYLAGVIVADLVLGSFFAPAKPRPENVAPAPRSSHRTTAPRTSRRYNPHPLSVLHPTPQVTARSLEVFHRPVREALAARLPVPRSLSLSRAR